MRTVWHLSIMASLSLALIACGAQKRVAGQRSAMGDLALVDGGSCGLDGTQKILVNSNTAKRIVATIRTDGSVASVPAMDANRVPADIHWPRQMEIRIAAGGRIGLGCSRLDQRDAFEVTQSPVIIGAYYISDDPSSPQPTGAPISYVRIIERNVPNSSCNPLVFILNMHPNRPLVVKHYNNATQSYVSDVPVPPQGHPPIAACAQTDGAPSLIRVTDAQWGVEK